VQKIIQLSSCLIIFIILLASCNGTTVEAGPGFEAAWIRPVPTGMKMTAGFGTLSNPGRVALRVTGFSSPSFGDVSLHRTELVDGVSRMREIPDLILEPASSVVLEPGGYHLMLMMPAREIQAGEVIVLEMTVEDGSRFSFEVPVERR